MLACGMQPPSVSASLVQTVGERVARAACVRSAVQLAQQQYAARFGAGSVDTGEPASWKLDQGCPMPLLVRRST